MQNIVLWDMQELALRESEKWFPPTAKQLSGLKKGDLVKAYSPSGKLWIEILNVGVRKLRGRIESCPPGGSAYKGQELSFERKHVYRFIKAARKKDIKNNTLRKPTRRKKL